MKENKLLAMSTAFIAWENEINVNLLGVGKLIQSVACTRHYTCSRHQSNCLGGCLETKSVQKKSQKDLWLVQALAQISGYVLRYLKVFEIFRNFQEILRIQKISGYFRKFITFGCFQLLLSIFLTENSVLSFYARNKPVTFNCFPT